MKQTLLLLTVLLAIAHCAMAQDIITKKSGDDIQAKVLEITETGVKYKKWSNQDGPTYTISKSDIFRIKYKNGDVDMFNDATQQATAPQQSDEGPTVIKPVPAANNSELINKYSKDYAVVEEKKDKPASYGIVFLKFDDSSILSTKDLEMTMKVGYFVHPDKTVFGYGNKSDWHPFFRYDIMLTNKTDKIMYINMANTMKWSNLGVSSVYYNPDQISSTTGNASGAGIGIGIGSIGIGVGGGKSTSLQHGYVGQQVISIAPHATKALSQFKYAASKGSTQYNWGNYETPERAEEFYFEEVSPFVLPIPKALCVDPTKLNLKRGLVNIGEEKVYTMEDSPYVLKYNIVYSTDPTFKSYSMLTPVLYIDKIVGQNISVPNYITMNWCKEAYIKKIIPNYDGNAIIGPVSFSKQK